MRLLITKDELDRLAGDNLVACECYYCNNQFSTKVSHARKALANQSKTGSGGKHYVKFCSRECSIKAMPSRTITKPCANCATDVTRSKSDANRVKNLFCSRSCAASYNNTHKTKGTRRSKLEVWLEVQLATLYPNLDILYCDKQAINGELDIYVPSLRLAFELNGIYHYEPIHGQKKLDQVQSNDHRKFQACIEHGIELVIMDTSQLKYFKLIHCQKYLDIITGIIDCKLLLADPGWVVSK